MSEEIKSGLEEISGEEIQNVEASGGNKIRIDGKVYEIVLPSTKSCYLFATGTNPYAGKYADSKHCGGCANLRKHSGFWYCKATKC